jgi:ribosomal protein S12 methylthiotransferase accessory factor YcaO
MRYILKHISTRATTGHFQVEPDRELSRDDCIKHLIRFPLDLFLHRHLLHRISNLTDQELKDIVREYDHPVVFCLAAESGRSKFCNLPADKLRGFTPLGELDLTVGADPWMEDLNKNTTFLTPLPATGECPAADEGKEPFYTPLKDLPAKKTVPGTEYTSAREVAETALFRLQTLGALSGREMRHENSMAPVGLMRKWFFQREVQAKGLDYSLHGTLTGYGRGLDIDSARAGLLMEIVERYSSFASVRKDSIQGLSGKNRIHWGAYSELIKTTNCLCPGDLLPDYPYRDEELAWMPGREITREGAKEILVPVQTVFLFSNLLEKNLFAAPASTGLAAGTSPEQAELNALLEVLERDALALGLFSPGDCFRLCREDLAQLTGANLLPETEIIFQDITPDSGVPAYKAFIRDRNGNVFFGSGAHLNGEKALTSALTEIPVPDGFTPHAEAFDPSLNEFKLKDLPDYSSGEDKKDLDTLCLLLQKNGFQPVFADLTRRDLGFPVTRAIVPGLEPSVDFDSYRRPTPRLIRAWQRASGSK